MSIASKLYISAVALAGAATLVLGLSRWTSADPLLFALLLAAAVIVSGMKVRLPGANCNISAGSLFLLLAIGRLSMPEIAILAASCALVQSVVRTKKTPRLEQVAFNVAMLTLTAVGAWGVSRPLADSLGGVSGMLAGLIMAAQAYALLNTTLVAGVLSLTSAQPFLGVWKQCHIWSFLYYVAVVPLAGVAWYVLPAMNWLVLALLLPAVWMVHTSCGAIVQGFKLQPAPQPTQ
jgi:hypothetical protein